MILVPIGVLQRTPGKTTKENNAPLVVGAEHIIVYVLILRDNVNNSLKHCRDM